MEPFLTARVAVEKAALPFDKGYRYAVDPQLRGTLRPGCRVLVPFGGGNGKRQGIVLSLEEGDAQENLKPVTLQVDQEPLLDEEMMALVRWLRAYFFCTYYDAVRMILPPGSSYVARSALEALPCPPQQMEELTADQVAVYRLIAGAKGKATAASLSKSMGMGTEELVGQLVEKGLVRRREWAQRALADETVLMASLPEDFAQKVERRGRKLTSGQRSVASFLEKMGRASLKEVCYFAAVTPNVVRTMERGGLVELTESRVYRSPYRRLEGDNPALQLQLSPQQQQVYEQIAQEMGRGEAGVGLLYGVTGSGKTVVFLKLIQQAVSQGKGAILMVPEIGLTPQMVDRFRCYFGEQVAVIHSGLSQGERLDEFHRIQKGEAKIVVGTRSAVFAPVRDLGLIIIDEEQEQTYKSDAAPRFHARDVAKFRCVQRGCLLLLASATPSLETYYHAQNGDYRFYQLPQRYGSGQLPQVELVDMRRQTVDSGSVVFSTRLLEELEQNLKRGEQSILLLNRRGFYTVVTCADCQQPVTCPNCSISLTYHQANGQMMCHYCGYSQPMPQNCSHCGSELIRCGGYGTQKCEEELKRFFPSARVLRMDQDTTLTKDAHEKYFLAFSKGEYDILVGTQMVAKGLDFPNVTLVGVLAADQILYSGSFRGYEKAFSLLTQVVGRCGRGERSGRALIQTHTPENPVFSIAMAQDYPRFYREEIESRRLLLYPPFCDVCTVGFTGVYEDQVVAAGVDFVNALRRCITQPRYASLPMKVFGPVSWDVVKVNQKFRYKIMVKCRNTKLFREMIRFLLDEFSRQPKHKKITVFADFYFE